MKVHNVQYGLRSKVFVRVCRNNDMVLKGIEFGTLGSTKD